MGRSLDVLRKALNPQRFVLSKAASDLRHVNAEPTVVPSVACSSNITF